MLPVLRLGAALARNPSPAPSGPDALSRIMDQFVTDMEAARTTLSAAGDIGITPFDLTLDDLWFDVEWRRYTPIGRGSQRDSGDRRGRTRRADPVRTRQRRGPPLTIRFDHADHAWLTAYTHMLSGFGNLFLAFDPEPVLRDLAAARSALEDVPEIPNFYDRDALAAEITQLEAEAEEIDRQLAAIEKDIAPLLTEQRDLFQKRVATQDADEKAAISARIEALRDELSGRRPNNSKPGRPVPSSTTRSGRPRPSAIRAVGATCKTWRKARWHRSTRST